MDLSDCHALESRSFAMLNTKLSVSADLHSRLQAFVDTGKYATEADVVRAALDALDFQTTDVAAIQEGTDDFQAGRFRSLEEVLSEFED